MIALELLGALDIHSHGVPESLEYRIQLPCCHMRHSPLGAGTESP